VGDDCSAPPTTTAPFTGDAARPFPATGTSNAAAVDDDEAEGSIVTVAGGLLGGGGVHEDMTRMGIDVASDFFKSPVAKTRRVQTKKKMRNETLVHAACTTVYCVIASLIDELLQVKTVIRK
jgi:hypothetical protein